MKHLQKFELDGKIYECEVDMDKVNKTGLDLIQILSEKHTRGEIFVLLKMLYEGLVMEMTSKEGEREQ